MKRLLCFIICIMIVFAFAACGSDNSGNSSTGGESLTSDTAVPTLLKFDAESYTVSVDGYNMISDHLTVEPAGAKVVYSVSDEETATITKKGEVYGVKGGETTVTAASEDGTVKAECKVVVIGYGSIVARDDKTGEGGITNKRIGAPETPDDSNAIVLIISKNLPAGTDMTNAVALNYGERTADGYYGVAYDGYYVAKTNDKCNFLLTDVPEGDYVGLIISGKDYTSIVNYAQRDSVALLKESALGSYFTDAELAELSKALEEREFYVGDLTVKANETTIFCHGFAAD